MPRCIELIRYLGQLIMYNSRTLYNIISRIHEGELRTVYSDYKSPFNKLLDKNGSFKIHQANIQSLAIEIYKYLHDLTYLQQY